MIDVVQSLPRHPEKNYVIRRLRSIDTIVVHHAAADHNPWQIARHHVSEHDWPGIGYDAVITSDALVWKTTLDREIGYHVRGHNTRSLGICIAMDLEEVYPPHNVYLAALRTVIRYADAYSIGLYQIKGHREMSYNNTICPGALNMERFRKAISTVRGR